MDLLVRVLAVLTAVLSDASYAALVGVLLTNRWLDCSWPDPHPPPAASVRKVFWVALGIFAVTHLVRPWFVASSMGGSTAFFETLALTPAVLSGTRQGGLWFASSAAIVALTMVGLRKKQTGILGSCVAVAALCVFAATKAASSHAADEGDFTLLEFSQVVHLIATAIWAGAVLVAGIVVIPSFVASAEIDALWKFGGLLSRTVTVAVLLLGVSGIYTTDRELSPSLSALWTSTWGRILLLKIACVGAALMLGALCRFKCLRLEADSARAMKLAKWQRTEAAVMVVVLSISGVLASTNRVAN